MCIFYVYIMSGVVQNQCCGVATDILSHKYLHYGLSIRFLLSFVGGLVHVRDPFFVLYMLFFFFDAISSCGFRYLLLVL